MKVQTWMPGLLCFLGLSITFSCIYFPCKFGDGFGIAGLYISTILDANGQENTYQTLSIKSDNTVIVTSYYSGEKHLETAHKQSYFWSLRYSDPSHEDIPETIEPSIWQFSFDNSSGGSMFQYYFFKETMSFKTKTALPIYGNRQLLFTKS